MLVGHMGDSEIEIFKI